MHVRHLASLPGGAFAPVFEDQDEPDFYGRRAGRPTLEHTARYSSCHSNDYSQCHEISIWDGSAFIEHAVKHASPSGDGVEAKAGSAIPAAVRDELATEAAACPSGKLRREPSFLERRDVNADGKPDYVLRWRAARCVGTADHGWCKAGRCLTEVFASRPDGTYARAYDTDDAVTFQRHNGVMAMEFPATCARQKQTSCSILEWVDGGFLGLPTILG